MRRVRAARDGQAMADVGERLPAGQRPQVPAQRDALVQLRERRIEQQSRELRLAYEHEAEQLLGAGLEVREETEALQHLERHRLRLVDDDDGDAPLLPLREQMVVQRVHRVDAAGTAARHAELARNALEEVVPRERRVEDERRRDVGPEVGEERAQHRRLAGADLAGDADEAAGLGEAEAKMRERFGVLRREIEEARIGCQPKGRIRQPEELFVHRSRLL
jgi:hypothetical protein